MALKSLFNIFNSFSLCLLKSQYLHINVHSRKNYFKQALKMNTVYFHNELGDNDLYIQFNFNDESLRINKVFTFKRSMSESINLFLKRLNHKLFLSVCNKNKSKSMQEFIPPEIDSVFLINNEQIPTETNFENMISKIDGKNLKLRILSHYFEVLMNCPTITDLSLPENIYVGCPVFPDKFKGKCLNKNDCQFTWFKSKNNKNWTQCSEKYFYNPTAEDLDYMLKIKCLPKNGTEEGPIIETKSSSPIKIHNNLFLIEKRHKFTSSKTSEKEIRVVSYNLLADIYATTKDAKTDLFTYCNPSYIDFKYRKNLILTELSGYNADLMCLQEVDKKMFVDNLLPYFESRELNGEYVKKINFNEGCAFFYNIKKFELLNAHQHFLSQELEENPILSDIKEKVSQNNNLMTRINGLKTQLQVGVLRSLILKENIILIANAHLYFHFNADHIRLLQGIICFKILLQYKKELEEKNPNKKINLIFCGDFNSLPDNGIYKFMTMGSVKDTESDWKSKPDETVTNVSFSNPLKMQSACGTPKYTNYTKDFKECIDYIFFQTDNLELKHFVPLPSEEDLSKEIALPSAFFPSDHIALVADLKWKS